MDNGKRDYGVFCERHGAELPVFVQPWYLEAACAGGEWGAALAYRNEEPVAALPYYLKRKGPFLYSTLPPLVKMMGPYFSPSMGGLKMQHRLMRELEAALPTVDFFNQDFHYGVSNWLPFYWRGYGQSTRYSYWIEGLEDLDGVLGRVGRDYRRRIRKVEGELRVVEGLPLRRFYELCGKSFAHQGLPFPLEYDFLERLDGVLAQRQARCLLFAVDGEDRIHAASYLTWDGHCCYALMSGHDPALRQSGGNIFITWASIKYAAEQVGVGVFDFQGSMLEGIERVRRDFGATQHRYFNVQKYHSASFRLLQAVISRFKKGVI